MQCHNEELQKYILIFIILFAFNSLFCHLCNCDWKVMPCKAAVNKDLFSQVTFLSFKPPNTEAQKDANQFSAMAGR